MSERVSEKKTTTSWRVFFNNSRNDDAEAEGYLSFSAFALSLLVLSSIGTLILSPEDAGADFFVLVMFTGVVAVQSHAE